MSTIIAILIAFLLDFALGDPRNLPHPICLLGNLVAKMEKWARSLFGHGQQQLQLAGVFMVIVVLVIAYIVPFFLLQVAGYISPHLQFAIEVIMFYQIFAMRSLRDESMAVYNKIMTGDLDASRVQLSWIVGRDTAELSFEEITKATVETVAENTTDGVIAPMLFMFLGGAPLAFLYKAVNTMDSMVGYRNEKYLHFGMPAAKLDDLFNYFPARISAFLMIAAAYFLGLDACNAWKVFKRDRNNHLSPNSAQTEAVCAGALGIQLGGGHNYFGKFVYKPTIGDALRCIEPLDIKKSNDLMYFTAVLGFTLCSLILLASNFLRDGLYV
ncbi:MAG TPA: cobalamin biosynthesis protein CobD [Candidatus Avacidaminococcus intestinavium]|uniref:Cobalamin biosynthesis protein CobD n=1 Tax=Candidatus Avacidaminococcus intestinavium TaxID=2840684 RepID=A0A9D1MQD3_9FIRM|nr:cobalamin biosynthesis protein CobD [Candidatus Avacidaminococcus intestinavium]